MKGSTPAHAKKPLFGADPAPDPHRSINKHNFFSIIDGGVKIIGLFDGHGEEGHHVSSAAMGIMLDYIRNKNDVFKTSYIQKASPDEIMQEIKKAFRYTQSVIRQDHQLRYKIKKEKEEKAKLKEEAERNNACDQKREVEGGNTVIEEGASQPQKEDEIVGEKNDGKKAQVDQKVDVVAQRRKDKDYLKERAD